MLVVDDEPRLVKTIQAVLQFEGFRVVTAGDGEDALAALETSRPDLVLLDVMLPGEMDGYKLCREMRARSGIPIIMVTACTGENDLIRGFDAGADDYLGKPFSSRELLARIKAVLRRAAAPTTSKGRRVVSGGDLEIDLSQRRVLLGGNEVVLTATEYRLLSELAENFGKVMGHEELLERVWGPEYTGELDYLRAYVRRLRMKIEPNPGAPVHLQSRPGMGYVLAGDAPPPLG